MTEILFPCLWFRE